MTTHLMKAESPEASLKLDEPSPMHIQGDIPMLVLLSPSPFNQTFTDAISLTAYIAKLIAVMVLVLGRLARAMVIPQHIDSSVQGVRLLSFRKTSQAPNPITTPSETQTR